MILSSQQDAAIRSIHEWYCSRKSNVFYLGGYAGSGKSTLLPMIVEKLRLNVEDIAFCAPTGKAAKVMSKKLQAHGVNVTARTIHSYMYQPNDENLDKLVRSLNEHVEMLEHAKQAGDLARQSELETIVKSCQGRIEKLIKTTTSPKFFLNVLSPLSRKKLIIVDEASMVGRQVANDLASFGVPILAIGDPGQLPPVGDEAGLTVGNPDAFLTEIHRQAQDNPIIWLSMQVRERGANYLTVGNFGDGAVNVVTARNDTCTISDEPAQVICGTNKRRWILTNKIRQAYGFTSTGPMRDERLIVLKNSRLRPALVNGSILYCEQDAEDLVKGNMAFKLSVTDESMIPFLFQTLQYPFEDCLAKEKESFSCDAHALAKARRNDLYETVDWAWVITAHKSQGSQFDKVVVHDESHVFKKDAAKWLYTSITRAANKLTVVI